MDSAMSLTQLAPIVLLLATLILGFTYAAKP
jgi:hypothetical protein